MCLVGDWKESNRGTFLVANTQISCSITDLLTNYSLSLSYEALPHSRVVRRQPNKHRRTMSFSQSLSFHRSRLGWTQSQASLFLHTPHRTYQDCEYGKHAPNGMTQQLVIAMLEGERTDFAPSAKARAGRPSEPVFA